MNNDQDHNLPESVKSFVKGSGLLSNLKRVSQDNAGSENDTNLAELKQQAKSKIEDIQTLLVSGTLDEASTKKLASVLDKLQSALSSGAISAAMIASALSEASSALNGTDHNGKALTNAQITEKLWQQVAKYNEELDDDFEKMRKCGIKFNDKLWNRHKELNEHMRKHPHDIAAQKELDAVDDAMLVLAENQIGEHPEAKEHLRHAKKISKERHEVVDKELVLANNKEHKTDAALSAFDDEPASKSKLTIDDVSSQTVGAKQRPSGRQQG